MQKKSPSSQALRVPPQSIESEQAVLGALMLRPAAIHEINDILHPQMFYIKKHTIIYETILELSSKSEPIDVLSISNKLKEKKLMNDIGGGGYLAEIMDRVPSTVNIRHYADIVYKKFMLRELIDTSEDIAKTAYDDTDRDVNDIIDSAEKKIFKISSAINVKGAYVSIKNSLIETWTQIEYLHEHKNEVRGVPTGFPNLDNLIAGLQPSDLIILAARPSVGKTTFALDIARNAALSGKGVAIFSLEMSANQLVQRMLSAESRVSGWSIRTGHGLQTNDFQALQMAMDRLSKAPIFIDDQAGNSIVKMRSVSRRLKSEHDIKLIVVDYLQLMTTSKNYDSMVNQVTEISRSLKQLAREINVPVLVLSQLNRAVEARGGKPRLSDLRDSGSIEQDADLVMFIHREDRYKDMSERDNIAEVLIEKHRNGPVGSVQFMFDGNTTSFIPIDKDHPSYAGPKATSIDDF